MSTIISCQLMGGLGNVLFQVFTTIAYGINHSRRIVFPYTETLNTGITRNTNWDNLLSSIKMMTTFNPSHNYTNSKFVRFSRYIEQNFHYSPIPVFDYKELILCGYFQSYKYFDNERERIFLLLRLRDQQENIINDFPRFLDNNCYNVSMHFRLADYINIQDCHPLMPYEYYENALEHILMKRTDKKILVHYFCQECDNETVEKMIFRLKMSFRDIEFVKTDDTIPDWKQLLLMSCCQDNIIANSTFSWWAAYFNKNKDKIICYPNVWFGPSLKHNTEDLFPESWTRVRAFTC